LPTTVTVIEVVLQFICKANEQFCGPLSLNCRHLTLTVYACLRAKKAGVAIHTHEQHTYTSIVTHTHTHKHTQTRVP